MKIFRKILALKILVGSTCLVLALNLALLTLSLLRELPFWTKCLVAIFNLGLIGSGLFLIFKRHSRLSNKARLLLISFIGLPVVSVVLTDIGIRYERKALQARASAFLQRPIPKLLVPDSEGNVGGFYVDPDGGPQNGVLGYSRELIERYAANGRIRWSARIQGQFASTSKGVNINYRSEAIETNEEVRLYLAERNAILGKEWQMGFWQYIEDSIELKFVPPEIEEENRDDRFVRQLDGTWTNGSSDALTIEPSGRFSATLSVHHHTNSYDGNWVARVRDPALILFFKSTTGIEPRWTNGERAEFKIIHLDKHILIYVVDHQTNSMSR